MKQRPEDISYQEITVNVFISFLKDICPFCSFLSSGQNYSVWLLLGIIQLLAWCELPPGLLLIANLVHLFTALFWSNVELSWSIQQRNTSNCSIFADLKVR